MQIFGKEIKDECSVCGSVLECELFKQGHGIKQERCNITELFACQMEHQKKREKDSLSDFEKPKGKLPEDVKAIYTEVWKIHKENPCPVTDDDWEVFNRRCETLLKMYDSKFARDLIQAMIREIEGRMRRK